MNSEYWKKALEFEDIIFEKSEEGIAKITINRPEVRNAFRPLTVREMQQALEDAREDSGIGVIILTGAGEKAFCSGGDQRIRGDAGYQDSGTGHLRVGLQSAQSLESVPRKLQRLRAGNWRLLFRKCRSKLREFLIHENTRAHSMLQLFHRR